MGATKIMIIRHAEKPGTYNGQTYTGINALGATDPESLVTLGWERAGGIASLFAPSNGQFQNAELATPTTIFASDPEEETKKSGKEHEPSQRPFQTISALAAKLNITADTSHKKDHYAKMIKHALEQSGTVLISWQHQDILPKDSGDDCIVNELLQQTGTTGLTNIPAGPWPGSRYDMVFVLDRPSGSGPFTAFTQVPQMLLAGDSSLLFT